MDDEKLVEAVRNLYCLWQVSSKSYKDLCAKENSWKLPHLLGSCSTWLARKESLIYLGWGRMDSRRMQQEMEGSSR